MNYTPRITQKQITEHHLEVELNAEIYEVLRRFFEHYDPNKDSELELFESLLGFSFLVEGYELNVSVQNHVNSNLRIYATLYETESGDVEEIDADSMGSFVGFLSLYGKKDNFFIRFKCVQEGGIDTLDIDWEPLATYLKKKENLYTCLHCGADLREVGIHTENVNVYYVFDGVDRFVEDEDEDDATLQDLHCDKCGEVVGPKDDLLKIGE